METSLNPHKLVRGGRLPSPHYSPRSDAVSQVDQLTPETASDSDYKMDSLSGHRELDRALELKIIAPLQRHSVTLGDPAVDRISFDKEPPPPPPQRYERKESFMLYTPDEESNIVKKLDRRLVLFVATLYMLSFLDRSST